MIQLLDRYRAASQRPFLRGAIQALRLHQKLSTLFASEEEPFPTFASAAGTLDLFEVGERRELWEALRGLEFLSLWPRPGVPPLSPVWKPPPGESHHGETRPIAPARNVSLDQAPAWKRQPVRSSEKAVDSPSKSAVDSAPPRTIAAVTPAREWPSAPVSIFWRTMIQRVPVPRWSSLYATPPGRSRQQDSRRAGEHHNPRSPGQGRTGFTTITGRAPQDRPEPRVIADARGSLELSWPAPVGRDPSRLDPAATERRPANDPAPSRGPLPAARSASSIAEQAGTRRVDQPDHPEASWRFLVSQSHGTALGIFQRVLLEPFFPGMHLGDVRVHTDEPADRAARSLGADAFSLGRDIFFRARRFDTSTARGLALVSHELSHTRQILGGEPIQSTRPRRELEHEAASIEATVLRAFTMGAVPRGEPGVAPAAAAGHRYGPLRLEPARATTAPSKDSGIVAAGGQRSIAATVMSGGATGRGEPLKAEQGRPAAGGAASPSSADDPEGATRTLLRMLDRKLRMDKERRGVDRWVR